jgi:hypothetical protein
MSFAKSLITSYNWINLIIYISICVDLVNYNITYDYVHRMAINTIITSSMLSYILVDKLNYIVIASGIQALVGAIFIHVLGYKTFDTMLSIILVFYVGVNFGYLYASAWQLKQPNHRQQIDYSELP